MTRRAPKSPEEPSVPLEQTSLSVLGVTCEPRPIRGRQDDSAAWYGYSEEGGARLFVAVRRTVHREPHGRWVIAAEVLDVRRPKSEGGEPVGTVQSLVYAHGPTFEVALAEAQRQTAIVANGAALLSRLATQARDGQS